MDLPDAQQAFQDFNHLFKTGEKAVGLEWRIRHQSGQLRSVRVTANLILDDAGKCTGFRGIARDTTDRNLAKQALEASEQCTLEMYEASRRAERRYRLLLEFFPEPVIVLNQQDQVTYINPAFTELFGWTLEELSGRRIPFIPKAFIEETRYGSEQLRKSKVLRGHKTKRLTKDGREVNVVLDAALYYEEGDQASGIIVTLRDKTEQERLDRVNKALFDISQSLYQFRSLDDRLRYIINQIRDLLDVKGASVIMLDEDRQEFFFRVTDYDHITDKNAWREIRFPADSGVAGYVVRTGKPLIVPDTRHCELFSGSVDKKTHYRTENMLDVPLKIGDRIIGVLCAVNKRGDIYSKDDVELLSTIASMVALPLENAQINEALNKSYEALKTLSRAQERVIHHLSHELKTPISVLSASLGLLERKITPKKDPAISRIMNRSQRNLKRLLDMQYEIGDIMKSDDYRTHTMMTRLLEASADALEMLVVENLGEEEMIAKVRESIDKGFLPKEHPHTTILLDRFIQKRIDTLSPDFAHRHCRIETDLQSSREIYLPMDVLNKVFDGLLRNAIENTPDNGLIAISTYHDDRAVAFSIQDHGIGIPQENQDLITKGFVGTDEISQYRSRQPFDFGAGGRGFDLLRTRIFAERYHFQMELTSRRCHFIPLESDVCPGDIESCRHLTEQQECLDSGGTTVTVTFPMFIKKSSTDPPFPKQ